MARPNTFRFAPGVVKDATELAASWTRSKRRWTDSDRIRFVGGLIQKLGGWAHQANGVFIGMCRGLLAWVDNTGVTQLAIGTNNKLYAVQVDTFNNITPIRKTSALTDPFTFTNTSADVVVTDAVHGAVNGDYVEITNTTEVAGITISGNYLVKSASANEYTITHSSAANADIAGGGSVTIEYEISAGRVDGEQGTGWGVGPYGGRADPGGYGYGEAAIGEFLALPPLTWTLDKWGEYLIANPRGGSIYEWQLSTSTRAAVLANAPTTVNAIFTTEEKHLVALRNDLVVQWCNQGENAVWSPSDQNSAGSREISGGSELLFGIPTRGTNLIFTDASVWTMTNIGGQDVFGFDQAAVGAAGIIGPRAAADAAGVVGWMGLGDFYYYDGAVRLMPNSSDIKQFVYDNLTDLQKEKVYCGTNSQFTEWWWLYATGTEIDRYVKVNYTDWSWDIGTLTRTALIDRGIFDNPIMTGTDGIIYKHEHGSDDIAGTATATSSMAEFAESSPYALADGRAHMDIVSIIPDYTNVTGDLTITILTRDFPQATKVSTALGTVTGTTTKVDPRISGKYVSYKHGASSIGGHWRMGSATFVVEPGGER